MKYKIHVNQHKIRANDPTPLTCKTYKDNRYAKEVIVNGPCRVVYRPDNPLACGAKVWIETESDIYLVL